MDSSDNTPIWKRIIMLSTKQKQMCLFIFVFFLMAIFIIIRSVMGADKLELVMELTIEFIWSIANAYYHFIYRKKIEQVSNSIINLFVSR